MNSHCIVVNREAFREDFLPEGIVNREREIRKIRHCLYPATQRRKPLHVWIYGGSGAGKTLLARSVLKELRRSYPGIIGAYVNCWPHNSMYKVVAALVQDLRILGADQQDTVVKLQRVKRHLEDKPFMLILDDLDSASPRDRAAIIYEFCNMENTGLVCISRKKDTFFSLPLTIRSRLNPQFVKCRVYSTNDLVVILRDRANPGLTEECCSESILKRIAQLSDGDARLAVQTLRSTAEWAEQEGISQIKVKHLTRVWNDVNKQPKEYLLASLTQDHRMLYNIIRRHGHVLSGDLREVYVKRCKRINRLPIAVRTFSNYVNHLAQSGLVSCERARVKGKVRLFSLVAEGA